MAWRAVCSFPPSAGGSRLIANLLAVTTFDTLLEPRSLPSTGITRLPRYYGPFRLPDRPGLSLAGCALTCTVTSRGLPCCVGFLLRLAVALTPAGPPSGIMGHSPECGGTGLPFRDGGLAPAIPVFGACSAFTSVTACTLTESLKRSFVIQGFGSPPSEPLELLPARTTKLPGGIRTH